MNTQADNIPLNDASLDAVNGGYDVLAGLTRFGQSVAGDFRKGADFGESVCGLTGAGIGAAVGATIGALSGLKNEVGAGVNEAVVGLKTLMR